MGFFDWLTGGKKPAPYPPCLFPGCNIDGWHAHRKGPICAVETCSTHAWSKGDILCDQHYLSRNPICAASTCTQHVFKPEHTHCYDHWKIGETQRKKHLREMSRTVSWARKGNYNRLISFTSSYLRTPIERCDEQSVLDCLITKMGIHPGHAAAFTSSDAARGIIGWAPPLDTKGLENEGYEWTDFKGGKWYRSLSQPGPWTRHGGKVHDELGRGNTPTGIQEQSNKSTIIQNITYNIQDSAISGDIKADVNLKDD